VKKVLLIVIVLVASGAVWWFVSGSRNSDNAPVDETQVPVSAKTESAVTEPQSLVLAYTDSGFSVSQVVINVGDSVVFKNNSNRSFWPASDPHPVHTELSAFDSRTEVAPGQSFTMTFNQPGNWGFHNHLNSSEQGTVSVRQPQ
jgi:plastocyanin